MSQAVTPPLPAERLAALPTEFRVWAEALEAQNAEWRSWKAS